MKRGEVWVANLNPSRGAETGKIRPVLIVLADEMIDTKLDTIIVLPLTTQIENAERRLRPLLMPRDELLFESQVLVDQPRSLDRAKFGKGPLTRLTESEMKEVEHSLSLILGLDHD